MYFYLHGHESWSLSLSLSSKEEQYIEENICKKVKRTEIRRVKITYIWFQKLQCQTHGLWPLCSHLL
jgi:hypothetical protein